MSSFFHKTYAKVSVITCLCFAGYVSAQSETCKVSSQEQKSYLIELFTSDGCDSCPPANQKLNQFVFRNNERIIPVSLHVTYWNYLGWRDPFSQTIFDIKQSNYAKTAYHPYSYTPELFLQKEEWSDWRDEKELSRQLSLNETSNIKISINAKKINNTFEVSADIQDLKVGSRDLNNTYYELFLYEDNLQDKPKAGELKGSTLEHNHVARRFVTDKLIGNHINASFALDSEWNLHNLGVVASISEKSPTAKAIQTVDLRPCL